MNTNAATLTVGRSQTLTATVAPANATNRNVSWSSNNPAVATVSNTGVVTTVSVGTAIITATAVDGGHTATATVVVMPIAVTGVTLNRTSLQMFLGETPPETLTANVSPTNATNRAVTWSSSNPSVATVANGVVTAVALGTATITVTTECGNFTTNNNVEVFGTTDNPLNFPQKNPTKKLSSFEK